MAALIAVLGALLPSVSFAGLTAAQWVAIASAIGTAEPEIKAAIAALHPVFSAIASDLASGRSIAQAGHAAHARTIPSEMSGVR